MGNRNEVEFYIIGNPKHLTFQNDGISFPKIEDADRFYSIESAEQDRTLYDNAEELCIYTVTYNIVTKLYTAKKYKKEEIEDGDRKSTNS